MASRCALCLAGGGILGAAYEIGALAAVERYLEAHGIDNDFSLFVGVSAGAVVASLLAQGVSARALYERFPFDVSSPSIVSVITAGGTKHGRTWRLAETLREFYAEQGLTNLFSELRAPLLVPAVDVDAAEPRVFGRDPCERTTIADAVAASCAIPPVFGPLTIDGRRFVDGVFESQLNIGVAMEVGASRILAVDPVVPTRRAPGARRARHLGAQCARIEHAARTSLELAHARLAKPSVRVLCLMPTQREMYTQPPMSWRDTASVLELGFELTAGQLERSNAQAFFDRSDVVCAG